MLQAIRDKAQGWIAWVIVILISIPFALFGIQEYLGSSADPVVAEVEGVEVKESELEQGMRDFRESMRMALGAAYRQELFEGDGYRNQILDRLINEAVLRQSAEAWNMRGSDAQVRGYIQSIPAFQNQGAFDPAIYEAAVRNRGLSSAAFEALVRQELIMRQLQSGVSDSAFATRAELVESARLRNQQRQIAYARIPLAAFNDVTKVTEEEARRYYQENPDRYRVPERVKLAYLVLGDETLTPLVEVDEDSLREYFAEHRSEFFVEQERRIRHILIGAESGSAEEQLTKTEELLGQLRSGADFAELASEHSADPGSAQQGGDLGWVNRGVMVAPFEETAFSLQSNVFSEPVKTGFGYHIIEVTDIRGGDEPAFEQVRSEVEASFRKFNAEELFYDYHERLATAAYENPDSLEPAAEGLGLDVGQTDWISRGQALPEHIDFEKVANAAFSEDVLINRYNSEVLDVETTRAIVVRVIDHEAERVQAFEDVREQVIVDAAEAMASEKAMASGQQVLEKLRAGDQLLTIATENNWQHESVQTGRSQPELPAEVLDAAFALQPPEAAAKAFTGVVSAEGDYFVIAVDEVVDGSAPESDSAQADARQKRMASIAGESEFKGFTESLRDRADLEIKLKADQGNP